MIRLLTIGLAIFYSSFTFAQSADTAHKQNDDLNLDIGKNIFLNEVRITGKSGYNLDFEQTTPGNELPDGWWQGAKIGYKAGIDTLIKHHGKKSVFIQLTDTTKASVYSPIGYFIPAKYRGKKIEVNGYLKFKDVSQHVSLVVRMDDANGFIINMAQSRKIHGTKDWKRYRVKTILPVNAQDIYIFSVLNGPGKVWTDDIKILIDGKDITKAEIKDNYDPNPPKLPPYGNNVAVGGRVKLKDATIYYETYGSGEPILLLHGDGQSILSYTYQIGDLSKKYKVIAVDTRGHGKSSDLTTGPLKYEMFAYDMKQLLDSLHIAKANILGWSDGGIIALLMAIKYPSYVNKLAETGANLFPTDKAIKASSLKSMHSAFNMLKKDTSKYGIASVRRYTMMFTEPHISFESLRTIHAPALIMAGDNDDIVDSHTRAIAKNIQGSKLFIFKNSSHYVPIEKPKEFNDTVLAFFDGQ